MNITQSCIKQACQKINFAVRNFVFAQMIDVRFYNSISCNVNVTHVTILFHSTAGQTHKG